MIKEKNMFTRLPSEKGGVYLSASKLRMHHENTPI